jgi:hypothetical protein
VIVAAAGIDTWSHGWYLDPESVEGRHVRALATQPAPRGRLIPSPIAGHRVGWNNASGLLYAEGHPSADGLGRPSDLLATLNGLETAMLEEGVPVPAWGSTIDPPGGLSGRPTPGRAGVRRCDAACDLRFGSPADGLAVLAGIAALTYPRVQTDVRREPGGRAIETVYLRGHGGQRVLGRWYDKGVESNLAPRGEMLRPEDQRRWPKGHRRGPEELTGQYVREQFRRRFYPLWQASKGVTVAGPLIIASKLAELQDEGAITPRQAESLAGAMLLEANGASRQPRSTRYRRRAQARQHGLVIADGAMTEVEVNLHDVVEECMESEAWGGSDAE